MLADFINGGGAGRQDPRSLNFGKKTADVAHEFQSWEYLQAGPGEQWKPTRGTRSTRFHKGFHRRNVRDIGQDQDRKHNEAAREARRQASTDVRRTYLNTRDKQNGFNIITGQQFTGGAAKPPRRHQKKHFDENSVSEFLAREGDVLLRTSASRFHRPQIVTTKARTQRIRDEGFVDTKKYSSLLGIGRADLESYGVADNFSRSMYPWNRPSTTAAQSQRGGRTPSAAPRATMSAGTDRGVLSGTARSVLDSGRSVASKPRRDPELHTGRHGTPGGLGRGSDAGDGGGVGARDGGGSTYSANQSFRSVRSGRSFASRGSVASRGSLRSAAASSYRSAQSRQSDIDFVRALPE